MFDLLVRLFNDFDDEQLKAMIATLITALKKKGHGKAACSLNILLCAWDMGDIEAFHRLAHEFEAKYHSVERMIEKVENEQGGSNYGLPN